MPTLKLTGKSGTTRTAPKRKPAAKSTPKRKPAARTAPKPAAAQENGNVRGPRLPEGMSKSEFNKLVKEMQKANAAKVAAAEVLAEAQTAVNDMALELLDEGIQMSVISTELNLSRQWMYALLAKREEAKPARKRAAAKAKPAAKRRPAAKATAKKAPARKAPARKRPPAPAVTGRGRVRLAA